MIRHLLLGIILALLLAGCAPQVIHEKPEYRRLAVLRLSPEKDSFRAQDISTADPAPLRVPWQNPAVVWSREALDELQSIRPALFLKYASRPGGLSGCHTAETALLQNRFAEAMKQYPVNPTGKRIEPGGAQRRVYVVLALFERLPNIVRTFFHAQYSLQNSF